MGRIPRDIVDAVRDRTDIVRVVGRHVTLRKAGNSFVGLCPFHQEKSPSFHVVPSKGIFHCFGCQSSGDVFRFLMEIEGLSFVESIKELAGAAGVEIEERELTSAERRSLQSRSTLFDILEAATQFFESQLWTHPDGQPGREYLRTRQLPDEIARSARLGFAPEGWSRLLDHLHRQGFAAERVMEAGLARPRKGGDGHYDTFRARLMFPIRDERGRVIGFGGRLLEGDGPKYINTPETRLYDKSRVLYGLERARNAIQRKDQVVVVEGYFDVLAMVAAGHEEAVATCGTALTPSHLERIRRMTRNVVMLTDGDKAGRAAAERSLPLLVEAGLHAFRVDLPGAKDPDEFRKEHGDEALTAALGRRRSLVEWVIDQKVREYADKTSMGSISTSGARERILEELLPVLSRLPDRQIERMAGFMRIPEKDVLMAVKRRPSDRAPAAHTPKAEGWKPNRTIVHIFWLLVHHYDQVADLLHRVPPTTFADNRPVAASLSRLLTGEPPAAVMEEEPDAGVKRMLAAVATRRDLYVAADAARALCDMVDQLVAPRLKARSHLLKRRMEDAVRAGDFEALRRHSTDNNELSKLTDALNDHLVNQRFDEYVIAISGLLDLLGTAPPEPVPVAETPADVPEVAAADGPDRHADVAYDGPPDEEIPPWEGPVPVEMDDESAPPP